MSEEGIANVKTGHCNLSLFPFFYILPEFLKAKNKEQLTNKDNGRVTSWGTEYSAMSEAFPPLTVLSTPYPESRFYVLVLYPVESMMERT